MKDLVSDIWYSLKEIIVELIPVATFIVALATLLVVVNK